MTDETGDAGAAPEGAPEGAAKPKGTLAENMRKALAMKRAAGEERHPDGGRTAGEGFHPTTGRGAPAPASGPTKGQDDTDTVTRSRGGQIRKRDGGGG